MKHENIIKTCKPIESLINLLEEKDFRIIEKEVSDYHFNELKIKMKGGTEKCLENIEIEGITRNDNQFFCSCHWSTVEIESEIYEKGSNDKLSRNMQNEIIKIASERIKHPLTDDLISKVRQLKSSYLGLEMIIDTVRTTEVSNIESYLSNLD